MNTQIEFVPVDLIDPHPHNPRRNLGDLTELAESIKSQGIRQNLLLVPQPEEHAVSNGRYTAVIGHRRLAAAKLAELEDVPCVIDEQLSEAQQIELMLLENIQRNDLSPIEEAEGYQQLLDLGIPVRQIVETTGRSEKTVTARIRLMKLPAEVKEKVHNHQATLEDAAQLDAFVGHPKLLSKVASGLGTSNFRWYLDDARRELKWAAVKKQLQAELKKAGISRKTGGDSYAYGDYRQVAVLTKVADLAKAIKEGIPDTAVWVDRQSFGIVIIRPVTDEERAENDGADANRQAAWEHDRQIREEGDRAYALRDEFIRGLMARKRLAAKDTLLILDVTLPATLCKRNGNATWDLARWAKADGYQSEDQLQAMLEEKFPNAEPALWLLVSMQLQAVRSGWDRAWAYPHTVALYGLLEQLGYPVSDAERARITAPVEDDEPEQVAS